MKYRLYNDNEPLSSTVSQILYNRGIPVEEQQAYLNASYDSIHSWHDFPEDDTKYAVSKLCEILEDEDPIFIVVDCDVDGFTSAAILANYINEVYPKYIQKGLLTFGFHEGKQHGLADMMDKIPPWTRLVVCPDSASGDFEQHNQLINEFGVDDVIVLDHHHCDEESKWATVLNNQMCDYPCKALTGAGVTWQFCRAFDELCEFDIFKHDPTYLLDLCALGNQADMADFRDPEIKAIVTCGFDNITNPLIQAIVNKNKASMDKCRGGLTYMGFAFYVAPYINAICRSGTLEEKELVFNAMLEYMADTEVSSTRRGHTDEEVPLVDEAVRVLFAVKRRQTDAQNHAMSMIEYKIFENNLLDDNAIVIECDEDDAIDPGITGLVANKIQATYQKPTIVVNNNGEVLRGSGRNYGKCPIEDFRKVCEDTEYVNFAQGHAGSFGIEIPQEQFENFIKALNESYANIDMTPVYWVDYVFRNNYMPAKIISDIAGMKSLWGQNIQEPLVALDRICLSSDNVQLLSPNKSPTLKITVKGVEIMKFKSSQEEYEKFIKDNTVLTAVCTCSVNNYMGKSTPQLIIEDFELNQEWVF